VGRGGEEWMEGDEKERGRKGRGRQETEEAGEGGDVSEGGGIFTARNEIISVTRAKDCR